MEEWSCCDHFAVVGKKVFQLVIYVWRFQITLRDELKLAFSLLSTRIPIVKHQGLQLVGVEEEKDSQECKGHRQDAEEDLCATEGWNEEPVLALLLLQLLPARELVFPTPILS